MNDVTRWFIIRTKGFFKITDICMYAISKMTSTDAALNKKLVFNFRVHLGYYFVYRKQILKPLL